MVVVPLSKPQRNSESTPEVQGNGRMTWMTLLAAGTLAASGALLATGKRKAGLVTAVAGTSLALLNEPEAVKKWWNALPGYIGEAQGMLGRAQGALEDLCAQRERLQKALGK
jgi:hypothetical protein